MNVFKQRSVGALWMLLALSVIVGSVAFAQAVFNRFGPSNGIMVGDATTYQTTSATSSDVLGLWSGTCADTTFLRGDGSCQVPPPTTGTGIPGGLNTYVQYNNSGSFSGDAGLVYNDTTDTLTTGAVTVGTAGSYTGRNYNVTDGTRTGFLQADGTGISLGASSNHPVSLYQNNTIECRIASTTSGLDCIDGFTSNSSTAQFPQGLNATTAVSVGGTIGHIGNGIVRLGPGTPTTTGYIEFYDAGAVRAGYIGFASSSQILLDGENGRVFNFAEIPTIVGAPVPKTAWMTNSDIAGGCVQFGSNSGIATCTRISVGSYDIDFTASFFSANPSCTATVAGSDRGWATVLAGTAETSVLTRNSAGTLTDSHFSLICVGT